MNESELKIAIVNKIIDERIWANCYICSNPFGTDKEKILGSVSLYATMNGVVIICPYCEKKISVKSSSG